MLPLRLKIKWRNSHEYIRLDLDRIDKRTHVLRTEEDWRDGSSLKVYHPRLSYTRGRDGSQRLVLNYVAEDHLEFKGLGAIWGQSTIDISPTLDSATIKWKSVPQNLEDDGPAPCILTKEEVPSQAERENFKRLKRAQAKFKQALLKRETVCAATGEGFEPALEAAHIQDVEDLGPNIPENGILLRADIHKLFDDGFFSINDDGTWKFDERLPSTYRSQFVSNGISDTVFERIKEFIPRRRQRICG